jgi:hypothetical protein
MDFLRKLVGGIWGAINAVSGMWLWGWLGGRTFVFIMSVLACTTFLEYKGHLEGTYAAIVGTLAGLFTARAVADDIIQLKNKVLTFVGPGDPKPPAGS